MRTCTIIVHEPEFSPHEILINRNIFPDFAVGDVIQIFQHSMTRKDALLLKLNTIELTKGISEISIQKNIANIFKIDTSKKVEIEKLSDVTPLQHVEMVLKDQYISGGQMWFFSEQLAHSTCFLKKSFSHLGVTAHVLKLLKDGLEVKSGYIGPSTKITFRSRSGYVYWLFQMSQEMWEYSQNGDLHFEKAMNFVTELYGKWKKLDVHHKLNIIFFSRFYEKDVSDLDGFLALKGRKYHDFYKCFSVETETTSLENLLILLKKEFIKFPKHIHEEIGNKMENSIASEGNILEAMNLVFDEYDKQHQNRNLTKTGFFIHVISAGSGVITINNPDIAQVTQHHIGTNEMTVDLICLSNPPLHGVPILRYHEDETDHYIYAYWLDLVFYQNEKSSQLFIPHHNSNERLKVYNFSDEPTDEHIFKYSLEPIKRKMIKNSFKKNPLDEIYGSPEVKTSVSPVDIHHSQSFSNRSTPEKVKTSVNQLMYCNPFDLTEFDFQTKQIRKKLGYTKQWNHLYPVNLIQKQDLLEKNLFLSNWKTLMEPACLPVTTDYWPSQSDINEKFKEFTYTVTIENELLLKQIVAQRLNAGFQIYHPPTSSKDNLFYLSKEDQLQIFSVEYEDLFKVKRYEMRTEIPREITYSYKLLHENAFVDKKIHLSGSQDMKWNHLDFFLSGKKQEDPFLTHKASLVQYYIIPTDENHDQETSFKNLTESSLSRYLVPQKEKFTVSMQKGEPVVLNTIHLINSTTKEWAQFIFKSHFTVNHVYMFQLQWILCSSYLINDFLSSFSRRAKQNGFLVFQVPIYNTRQVCALHHHPIFHLLDETRMNLALERLKTTPYNFLFEDFGKMLFHKSGTCLLMIHGTDLIWISNRVPGGTFDNKKVYESVTLLVGEITK